MHIPQKVPSTNRNSRGSCCFDVNTVWASTAVRVSAEQSRRWSVARESEEDHHDPVQADHVLVSKRPYLLSQCVPANRGDLVDHEAAPSDEAVCCVWLHD